ncbi:FG-GAP repeat protein, partial [Streptomyces sp. Tu 4128]
SLGLTDLDGDGHADLVVTAPGSDTIDAAGWVLPGTAEGPATEGAVRLSADDFDDTEGLGLLMGGAGIAR